MQRSLWTHFDSFIYIRWLERLLALLMIPRARLEESPLPVQCILTRLPNSETIVLFDLGCDISVFRKGWLIVKDLNESFLVMVHSWLQAVPTMLHVISPMLLLFLSSLCTMHEDKGRNDVIDVLKSYD
jgi:hypothetical protein